MKTIKAVIFDFGGVLSEEGFRNGLKAIGTKHGINPDGLFTTAEELIYKTGYIIAACDESYFWHALREKTGINESDNELREEILIRFSIRPEMIQYVKKLKSCGMITAILSDQTNWLDEIDSREHFFRYFDYVYNSFHLKKSKKDASVFLDTCKAIVFKPEEMLFVDDNIENVNRASYEGLKTIHFENMNRFKKEIWKLTIWQCKIN